MKKLTIAGLVTPKTNSTELNIQQQQAIVGGKQLVSACSQIDNSDKAICIQLGEGTSVIPWNPDPDSPYQDGFKAYDDGSIEPAFG